MCIKVLKLFEILWSRIENMFYYRSKEHTQIVEAKPRCTENANSVEAW